MRVPATNDVLPLQLGPKVPSTEVTPDREQAVAKKFGEVLFESVDLGRLVGITEADCRQFKVDEACPLRDGAVAAAPECGSLPPVQVTGFEPSALLGTFSEAAEKSKSAQPSADGWIEHDGKGRPFSQDTRVEVKYRDNEVREGSAFTWCGWDHQRERDADQIVAYRIVG